MKIITVPMALSEIRQMAQATFGDMVKAVVDIRKEIMAVDAEMHADEESLLLEHGSNQADLWGINLRPDAGGDNFIEFDSMINVRPSQGNRSRGVDSEKTKAQIARIVNRLVQR
jgi:hypothetical protein